MEGLLLLLLLLLTEACRLWQVFNLKRVKRAFVPFKECATQCGSGRLMVILNSQRGSAADCIVRHSKKVAGSILMTGVFPCSTCVLSEYSYFLPRSKDRHAALG